MVLFLKKIITAIIVFSIASMLSCESLQQETSAAVKKAVRLSEENRKKIKGNENTINEVNNKVITFKTNIEQKTRQMKDSMEQKFGDIEGDIKNVQDNDTTTNAVWPYVIVIALQMILMWVLIDPRISFIGAIK